MPRPRPLITLILMLTDLPGIMGDATRLDPSRNRNRDREVALEDSLLAGDNLMPLS
jgi:hypothetical protein